MTRDEDLFVILPGIAGLTMLGGVEGKGQCQAIARVL